MPAKTLRTIKDAKFQGTFTKQQIDRAIRTVERESGGDYSVRRPSRSGGTDKMSNPGGSGLKR
jgi:hypothetical protein